MNYIKYIGGLMLVICGTLAGVLLSVRSATTIAFYREYLSFLTQTQTMVSYGALSVREILERIVSVPMMENVLDDVRRSLDKGISFDRSWSNAIYSKIGRYGVNKEGMMMLNYFGETFGSSDVEGEIAKIRMHYDSVARLEQKMSDEYDSKRRIFRVTGMFAGVLTAVLLC